MIDCFLGLFQSGTWPVITIRAVDLVISQCSDLKSGRRNSGRDNVQDPVEFA